MKESKLEYLHYENAEQSENLQSNWPYKEPLPADKRPKAPKPWYFVDDAKGNTFGRFESLEPAITLMRRNKGSVLRPYNPTAEEHEEFLRQKRHERRCIRGW